MMWSLRNQNIVSEEFFTIFTFLRARRKRNGHAAVWVGGVSSFRCIIEKKIYKVIVFGYQNELKSIFN